ncbi:MAG: hypothetical protein L3J23_00960 [Flavobacteriaceae bacterium]|nr:hypothetical protein [Flavobacteriaceae bacterium]
MKTNKTNNKGITLKFNSVIKTTKKTITNANNFALTNAEDVIVGTINATKQWQEITSKALNGGFKLIENQQNIVFDTLESFKNQFIYGKKKFSKIFA